MSNPEVDAIQLKIMTGQDRENLINQDEAQSIINAFVELVLPQFEKIYPSKKNNYRVRAGASITEGYAKLIAVAYWKSRVKTNPLFLREFKEECIFGARIDVYSDHGYPQDERGVVATVIGPENTSENLFYKEEAVMLIELDKFCQDKRDDFQKIWVNK